MKLWEGLEQDFNFNAMVSQRGVINLFHSDPQRDAFARRGNAMRLAGIDARRLARRQAAHRGGWHRTAPPAGRARTAVAWSADPPRRIRNS